MVKYHTFILFIGIKILKGLKIIIKTNTIPIYHCLKESLNEEYGPKLLLFLKGANNSNVA